MKMISYLFLFIVAESLFSQSIIVWDKSVTNPFPSPPYNQVYKYYGITELNDGSVIWAVSLMDNEPMHETPALIKTDANGNLIWIFSKSFSNMVMPRFVIEDSNNDLIYHCIWVRTWGLEDLIDFRPLIIRIGADGNYIDDRCDSTLTYPELPLTFLNPGAFINSKNGNLYNFVIDFRKKNKLFVNEWNESAMFISQSVVDSTIFLSDYPNIYSVQDGFETDDEHFILKIGCWSQSLSFMNNQFIKVNRSNNIVWRKILSSGDSVKYSESIMKPFNDNSGFTIVGKSIHRVGVSSDKPSIFVNKFDLAGMLISEKNNFNMVSYGSNPANYNIRDFIESSDGDFFFVGDTFTASNKYYSYWAKSDNRGDIFRDRKYSTEPQFFFRVIQSRFSGNYYILGRNTIGSYFLKLQLESSSVFDNIENSLAIFPSPAHNKSSIIITGVGAGTTRINIYDVLGRLTASFEVESVSPEDKISVNLSNVNLRAGIYFFTSNKGWQSKLIVIE